MTDEKKLRAQSSRAAKAKLVLDNELVKEAFTHIEQRIESMWKESLPHDTATREKAYLMQVVLEEFKQYFVTLVHSGDFADKQLSITDRK